MKTLLLDVFNETVEDIEIEDELQAFYDRLDCSYIDIVKRKIGRKWFNVMCDDEGLFRSPQKISAVDNYGKAMFVGNLMFFHDDGEGNLVGLSDDDIAYIKRRITKIYTKLFPDGYPALTQCEYR